MGLNVEKIMVLFSGNEDKSYTLKELKRILGVKKEEDIESLLITLQSLEEEGLIISEDGKYSSLTKYKNLVMGTIKIIRNGAGIINPNNKPIYIEEEFLNGALDGDTVIVELTSNRFESESKAKVRKIVKRKTNDIVFVCHNGRLLPVNNNQTFALALKSKDLKTINEGDFVLVSIENENVDGYTNGVLIKKIGNQDDLDIYTNIIAARNGFELEFPDDVIEEINKIPSTISEEQLVGRVNLTDKNIFTIDCDDTQDRDDAVSVEFDEDGNFVLGVHIADVSSYVPINSKTFKEAYQRGTSVYLPGKTIPMLPEQLSQGACSLNENVIRLTNTVEITFDQQGNYLHHRMYRSFIKSKKEMCYSDVNKILDNNTVVLGYEDYLHDLFDMNRLSILLEKVKKRRGYLSLEDYEIKVHHDDQKNPVSFPRREDGSANKMIENFMIEANQRVAETVKYSDLTYLYRVHDIPDEDRITMILDILRSLGYKINNIKNFDNPKSIQSVLTQLSKSDEYPILSRLLLRGLKKASWSTYNIGHFGLALEDYIQFTSPIRRFADLVNHHLMSPYLDDNMYYHDLQLTENALEDMANYASKKERDADKAEEEANKLNMAIYMQNHIGEYFNGVITDITDCGVIVRTVDNVSGRVSFEDIDGDFFIFDKDKYVVYGRNTHIRYHIGDYVRIKVLASSPEMLTIDFNIKEKLPQKKLSFNKQ